METAGLCLLKYHTYYHIHASPPKRISLTRTLDIAHNPRLSKLQYFKHLP
jgi:hypothetical protein